MVTWGYKYNKFLDKVMAHISISTGLAVHSAIVAESPYDVFVNTNAVVLFIYLFFNFGDFGFIYL